ncbi:MAG: UDP-N-acetylglucosamine 1-carboxyvinyltransferase [Clostridia bacterium]|nr:UDP-N-acetylglucosamine 1-carboxyvinyltransferase [Clostridia bacterium]
MSKLIVNNCQRLYGKTEIKSAKNAMLPLIAACILLDFEVGFYNCPKISDVLVMLEIIESLGGKYRFEGDVLFVDCSALYLYEIPCELASKIRGSVFMLGPLIARFRKALATMPGGCKIGERPIGLHLDCFKKMGVEIGMGEHLYLRADNLQAKTITLPFKSVGVTENLIMLGCLTDGETTILNPAREPEIVCLCEFLKLFGAKIKGEGGNKIVIQGVKKLRKSSVIFKPVADRIETGTLLLAGLSVGCEMELSGVNYVHNFNLIKKVFNNTCKMCFYSDKIYLKSSGAGKGLGYIKTAPYPYFPTDLQSPVMAYATTLNGTTVIEETIFKDRFSVASELNKMGANVTIRGNVATVNGVNSLTGQEVTASDLRGGASLIIAGLKAEGKTVINNLEVIDRGYYKIENKLKALGAKVERI